MARPLARYYMIMDGQAPGPLLYDNGQAPGPLLYDNSSHSTRTMVEYYAASLVTEDEARLDLT